MTGARPGSPGTGDAVAVAQGPRVGRLEPVAGQQGDDLVARPDDASPAGGRDRAERHAAGRLRVDALEPGDVADRLGRDESSMASIEPPESRATSTA